MAWLYNLWKPRPQICPYRGPQRIKMLGDDDCWADSVLLWRGWPMMKLNLHEWFLCHLRNNVKTLWHWVLSLLALVKFVIDWWYIRCCNHFLLPRLKWATVLTEKLKWCFFFILAIQQVGNRQWIHVIIMCNSMKRLQELAPHPIQPLLRDNAVQIGCRLQFRGNTILNKLHKCPVICCLPPHPPVLVNVYMLCGSALSVY